MSVKYVEKEQVFIKGIIKEDWKCAQIQIIEPIMHTVVCIGGPAHLCRVSWPPEQSPELAFRVALCNCRKDGSAINYSGPGMKSMLYTYRPDRDGPMMHYELAHEDGENYYLYGPLIGGWWWCTTCQRDVNEPCNH